MVHPFQIPVIFGRPGTGKTTSAEVLRTNWCDSHDNVLDTDEVIAHCAPMWFTDELYLRFDDETFSFGGLVADGRTHKVGFCIAMSLLTGAIARDMVHAGDSFSSVSTSRCIVFTNLHSMEEDLPRIMRTASWAGIDVRWNDPTATFVISDGADEAEVGEANVLNAIYPLVHSYVQARRPKFTLLSSENAFYNAWPYHGYTMAFGREGVDSQIIWDTRRAANPGCYPANDFTSKPWLPDYVIKLSRAVVKLPLGTYIIDRWIRPEVDADRCTVWNYTPNFLEDLGRVSRCPFPLKSPVRAPTALELELKKGFKQ